MQRAGEVLDHFQIGRLDQFHDQFLVVEDEVAQLVGFLLVELVALHRGEHGAKHFRPEYVGKGIGTLLGKPEQQLAAGGVLADDAREHVLELFEFPFVNQQVGKLSAEFG